MTFDGVADGCGKWEETVLEKDCVCRLCMEKIPARKPVKVFKGNVEFIYECVDDCGLVTLGA